MTERERERGRDREGGRDGEEGARGGGGGVRQRKVRQNIVLYFGTHHSQFVF